MLVICLQADGGADGGRQDRGADRGRLDARGDRKLADGLPLDLRADSRADAPAPIAEQEPNDGKTKTEFQSITSPTLIQGAIGVPDDADVFSWQATAGDRLTVSVKSTGTLQPHLAVFGDAALGVPAAVNAGPKTDVMSEYYVLKTGSYFIAVRDRRNMGSSSQHVGGAGFGYLLSVSTLTRAPIPATVGAETAAALSPDGTIAVFSFTAAANDQLEVSVRAARLNPASSVDSRLSLFHPGQKAWLGTNDDLGSNATDSLLKGTMPYAGVYHAIVENEGAWGGSNMNVALQITKK